MRGCTCVYEFQQPMVQSHWRYMTQTNSTFAIQTHTHTHRPLPNKQPVSSQMHGNYCMAILCRAGKTQRQVNVACGSVVNIPCNSFESESGTLSSAASRKAHKRL